MPAPKGHTPYNKNGEGGRPRKFSQEDIEYHAEALLEWMKKSDSIWLKDYFLEHDIDPKYLSQWEAINERFAESSRVAKAYQESRIYNKAMTNTYNQKMSQFALTNNHGWVDKKETKLSGDAKNPLAFVLESDDGNSKDLVNDGTS